MIVGRLFSIFAVMGEKLFVCAGCGAQVTREFDGSVNVSERPELKEAISGGEYFVWECPQCGKKNLIAGPFLYTDPAVKLVVLLSGEDVASEGEIPGFTARQVRSAGELIEKIKISDAGLDDIAVEMCKYVTAQELGKDVDLKFFRIDGSDGDITLAYPQDGKMEMVQIGFNVYQDCCGILSRNPAVRESAAGLVRVDWEFISKFLA